MLWGIAMDKVVKKQQGYIKLCFKYHSCKLCPRNSKCEKELKNLKSGFM